MLEEQVEREQQAWRAMEEKIQKDCAENEKKERERELQQLEKEQAIRQRGEMKRDALQKELVKLTHSLEEQSTKEEDRKKHMDDLLRREREENQKERDIQLEKQRADKMRIVALQQELRLVKIKIEQQKTSEENLQRQLKESLRGEKERCDKEMSEPCDEKCLELCEGTRKKTSAEGCSTVANLTGYAQEMGLLGLNAALEMVGAPCCIQ